MSDDFEIIRNGYLIKSGFDLIGTLRDLSGPVVEVGGPTPDRDMPFISTEELRRIGKSVLVTNIAMQEGVDALMDATQLPVQDASLSAITGTYLPWHIKEGYMREAWRAVQPNGVVMTASLDIEETEGFEALGFSLVVSKRQISKDGRYLTGLYDIIVQKPAE